MPYPTVPTLPFSYQDFQLSQGDSSFPGTQLDNDLFGAQDFAQQTVDFLSVSFRSDGTLSNTVVRPEALSAEVLALMGNYEPRGNWTTGAAYAVRDLVQTGGATYLCAIAHTAAALFATDTAAGRWLPLAPAITLSNPVALNQGGTGATTAPNARTALGLGALAIKNAVQTGDVSDGAISNVKLATGIDGAKLVAGSVADAALALDYALVATTILPDAAGSLVGGGSLAANRTFRLDGDAAAPGNSQFYGTNPSGVKGFYPSVFTKPPFVSAEQTMTANGSLTIAHGLGVTPKLLTFETICKTAQAGWAVDNVRQETAGLKWGGAAHAGFDAWADATSIYIRFHVTNVGLLVDRGTGGAVFMTPTSWRLVARAYV
jgi:hypothetical protein